MLTRNSERIPRSLLERSGNPAAGAAGLASESKKRQNSLRRKIPCRACRSEAEIPLCGAAGNFSINLQIEAGLADKPLMSA